MEHEIIIAGAGHGGLVAAALLAKNGFQVDIYEKNARANMGWDWTDHISYGIFEKVGLDAPQSHEFQRAPNYSFASPDLKTKLQLKVPEFKRDISMERKLILKKLIAMAEEAGVKIHFEEEVKAPILENGILVGIKTNHQEIRGSLIIDSAGISTPIRPILPESYNMTKNLKRGEIFHAYRAFFNIVEDFKPTEPRFTTYFGFEDIRGISWFQTGINIDGNQIADVIFGKIDPFKEGEVDKLLAKFRQVEPGVGDQLLRGGQIAQIPIRRTFDFIVGDNYVVIGDAACMAKPLNGSGMDPTMIAGKILAETILQLGHRNGSTNTHYSVSELWKYQYDYMQTEGAKMAGIDLMKNYMMTIPFPDLSYVFEHELIKAKDMEASITGNELNMSFGDLLGRVFRGFTKLPVLLGIKEVAGNGKKIEQEIQKIPSNFDKEKINRWAASYNEYFKRFEKILQN